MMGPPKMVSGTHTIPYTTPILESPKICEWYGKLTIRGSHYWGSLKFPLNFGMFQVKILHEPHHVGCLDYEKNPTKFVS